MRSPSALRKSWATGVREPTSDDGRPVLKVVGGQLSGNADKAEEILDCRRGTVLRAVKRTGSPHR